MSKDREKALEELQAESEKLGMYGAKVKPDGVVTNAFRLIDTSQVAHWVSRDASPARWEPVKVVPLAKYERLKKALVGFIDIFEREGCEYAESLARELLGEMDE